MRTVRFCVCVRLFGSTVGHDLWLDISLCTFRSHKIYKTFRHKTLEQFKLCRSACFLPQNRSHKWSLMCAASVAYNAKWKSKKKLRRTTTDKVESRDLNFLLSSSTFGSGSGNSPQCAPFIFIFASFTSKSPELRLPWPVCYVSRVCVCVCLADASTGGCYIPIIDCQKTIFSKWRGGGPATTMQT